jgi:kinesin family protein 5
LLCCCSPSPSNALESLSTLRFGMRYSTQYPIFLCIVYSI